MHVDRLTSVKAAVPCSDCGGGGGRSLCEQCCDSLLEVNGFTALPALSASRCVSQEATGV